MSCSRNELAETFGTQKGQRGILGDDDIVGDLTPVADPVEPLQVHVIVAVRVQQRAFRWPPISEKRQANPFDDLVHAASLAQPLTVGPPPRSFEGRLERTRSRLLSNR